MPDNLPAVVPIDDFDLADEEQILHELAGRVTEKFLYPGDRGEQLLSYAGINWAVREYAKQGEVLRVVGDPIVRPDDDPEYVLAIVRAERVIVDSKTGHEIHLDSCFGAKRKWKKQTLKDKTVIPDPSYWEKAISMAERNAKRKLMPVDFVQRMVAIALGKKNKPAETQKTAAKPPVAAAKSATPPPAAPAATPTPSPAAPAAAPAPAPAPAPAQAPAPPSSATGTATMGNRVYAALSRVEAKNPAWKGKKKVIFSSLMGVDSTTKISQAEAEALVEAANLCTCVPAIHEIREVNGTFQMVTLPDGNVVYPKAPAQATAAPVEAEGMF